MSVASLEAQVAALLPTNNLQFITAERLRTAFNLVIASGTGGSIINSATGINASVVTCSTPFVFDDTIPQITEGNEVVTVAFTPVSATSNIQITFSVTGSTNHGANLGAAVFQDAVTDALTGSIGMGQTTGSDQRFTITWSFSVASGSTTARTYRVRLGTDGGANAYVNGNLVGTRLFGGSCLATVTATEISS